VLLAIVGALILFGGGCAVCVMLAGSADIANGSDASTAPPLGGPGQTALAKKLEEALKADKIPVEHVECPPNPPASGRFSCTVVTTTNGDPAEVDVTLGSTGMSYQLQEGFVVLEGAKLATTFAGIAPYGSARRTVPCFHGSIMKHVDSSFSCDVMDGSVVVGQVTTTVVNKTGQVKMSYQAAANAGGSSARNVPPPPIPGDSTSALNGTYACMVSGYKPGGGVQVTPSNLGRFTIAGGAYSSTGGGGPVRVAGEIISFSGGPYNGWQGLIVNSSARYIQFRGSSYSNAMPGVPTKIGDHQCYVQK
jgi:hypothetical protein